MVNPDFVKLAESMHCKAIRCTSIEDLPAKMKEFMEYDGNLPILMECEVVKNEHVYPMVFVLHSSSPSPSFLRPRLTLIVSLNSAAGKALHEQIVHPLLAEKTAAFA